MGHIKFRVHLNQLTPEQIIRLYEYALSMVDMQSLHTKSEHNPNGLVSLPNMLRHEPGNCLRQWLRLNATKEVIEGALPKKTPYQLQYFTLFPFQLPQWQDLPLKESGKRGNIKEVGEISSIALLFGKNQQLYFVSAKWTPEEGYFAGGKEPRYRDDWPFTFNLNSLVVENIEWKDARILERVTDGQWSDISGFIANLGLVLDGTANILEERMFYMRHVSKVLAEII